MTDGRSSNISGLGFLKNGVHAHYSYPTTERESTIRTYRSNTKASVSSHFADAPSLLSDFYSYLVPGTAFPTIVLDVSCCSTCTLHAQHLYCVFCALTSKSYLSTAIRIWRGISPVGTVSGVSCSLRICLVWVKVGRVRGSDGSHLIYELAFFGYNREWWRWTFDSRVCRSRDVKTGNRVCSGHLLSTRVEG